MEEQECFNMLEEFIFLNDIACLDILTKSIKLMDLQGYMAST